MSSSRDTLRARELSRPQTQPHTMRIRLSGRTTMTARCSAVGEGAQGQADGHLPPGRWRPACLEDSDVASPARLGVGWAEPLPVSMATTGPSQGSPLLLCSLPEARVKEALEYPPHSPLGSLGGSRHVPADPQAGDVCGLANCPSGKIKESPTRGARGPSSSPHAQAICFPWQRGVGRHH